MEKLHTEEFDDQLKLMIPHLNNYPELLPLLGRNGMNIKQRL